MNCPCEYSGICSWRHRDEDDGMRELFVLVEVENAFEVVPIEKKKNYPLSELVPTTNTEKMLLYFYEYTDDDGYYTDCVIPDLKVGEIKKMKIRYSIRVKQPRYASVNQDVWKEHNVKILGMSEDYKAFDILPCKSTRAKVV